MEHYPQDYLFHDEASVEDDNDGVILSDDDDLAQDDGNDDDQPGTSAQPVPVKVEPKKKKVVRNPQNLLNEAKLCGPRGICALHEHFKDFKFRGKGHEAADLDRMMRRYVHWAHRLYPKFHFDDCVAKIQKLGTKKSVQLYMNSYRTGNLPKQPTEGGGDPAALHSDSEEDDADGAMRLNRSLDPLDSMLDEQIALSRRGGRNVSLANTSGIGNLSGGDTTFDAVRQTAHDGGSAHHANALKDVQQVLKSPPLNDDIRAKIEANRQRALELRKARMLLSQSQNADNRENDTDGTV
uniref:TIMELESS-interacting protein n=1 Tax=Anopheles dirus TaxID=7168 RepID=A0A182NUR1_9DIPT